MSHEKEALASAIRIDSLEQTVVRLSNDLASVTLDLKAQVTYGKETAENAARQSLEVQQTNLSLLTRTRDQDEVIADLGEKLKTAERTVTDQEEALQGYEHQLARRDIISAFLVRNLRNGRVDVKLPRHETQKKAVKSSELIVHMDSHTYAGAVEYVDTLYQQLDNPELRRLLRE